MLSVVSFSGSGMDVEGRFGSVGEAIGALDAAVSFLAKDVSRKGSAADQLAWINDLRSIGGRVSTVVSVWLAEADRSKVAQQAAGTTVTDWLTRAGKANRKEAAGILDMGEAVRTVTPEIRLALNIRDGGLQVPGV